MAADTPLLPLDAMVVAATTMYPGERPLFVSFDEDRPVVNVTTGPRALSRRAEMHIAAIDRRTARKVEDLDEDAGVMAFILRLYVDMFLDLPGKLFLGVMGVLFFVAIVSGAVVYAPFMQRLRFGTVRTRRSSRVRWLDTHDMLGIVTLMWLSVVGLTGVINTLSEPLVDVWRADQPSSLTGAYASKGPGTTPQFVAFPRGYASRPSITTPSG